MIASPLPALRALRRLPVVNASLRRTLGASPWRNSLPPALWKRLPVHGEITVAVPGSPGFKYLSRGEPLGKVLFWRGIDGFEPGSASVFRELARDTEVFLDVGAYSGYYTLLATTTNPRCVSHCFEPVPAIRAWLMRNLELNGVAERVRVVAAAVSNHGDGAATFYVSANTYSPGSSLLQAFGSERRTAVTLPMTTIDDYVASLRLQDVGLLKIDTEGAEAQVLQGARGLLESQRPALLCEILDNESTHLETIEGLLRDVGYSHALVTERGLQRQPRITPDPTRRLRNFLLWPSERALSKRLVWL